MCLSWLIQNRGIISEKPSEVLFTLDTQGSEAIQRSYNKLHKPLKADEILAQRSAVPPVDNRKRSRTTDGVVEKSSKRRKENGVSAAEFDRLRLRAYGGEKVAKNEVQTDVVPAHDPWQDIEEVHDPQFSYLEKKKAITLPKTLREPPMSLLQGKKIIPGVLKPKNGNSYNPLFQDWDEILIKEGQKEVKAEKKRLRETQLEEERLARIEAAQNERDDIPTEDESAWEGFESEHDGAEWLTKPRPERKTPTERKKMEKRKTAEKQTKEKAEVKRRRREAEQIISIAKEVDAKQTQAAAQQQEALVSSDEEIDDRILRRRRFGKSQYVLAFAQDLCPSREEN